MLAVMNSYPNRVWRDMHQAINPWKAAVNDERQWLPAIDIIEEEDRYVFHADLPGVSKEDVEVVFENGELIIKGQRTLSRDQEQQGYRRYERSFGSFRRSFKLPETIEISSISAQHQNGVLEIVVPKKEKAQKKIEING